MLLFSLGTTPLMLGLGSAVSALGQKFVRKVMVVGAVFVVVLGLAMLSQGGSLSGFLPGERLLPIIIGLSGAGMVAIIPFSKPLYRKTALTAVFGGVILLVAVWNMGLGGKTAAASSVELVNGRQAITSTLTPGSYPNITVQANTPVTWTINAPEGSINGCNNRMHIQEYGITDFTFQPGENVIEFTPDTPGEYEYSCWMGMIRGTITVTK